MNRTCEHCRAYFQSSDPALLSTCRLHPVPIVTSETYWCLDWQAKEKPKAERGTIPAVLSEFEQFWAEFPKKIGKKAALKAFLNARDCPPIDDLLEALRKAKRSPQWLKDNGQFIPHPATWLNRGQWADVPPETKPSVFEEFLARGEGHDEIEG